MAVITLSLISHTNVGKTTLARTLLRRDVGEVRDAAHVTAENSSHTMVEAEGHTLRLWDTPGFGDTSRLLKRLQSESNPVKWFLTQAWDRWRDRALWHSQQALKNVREEADVVLYLVSAAEGPGAASYVPQEMEILSWLRKPVVVLLNQIGPPRSASDELADIEAWRTEMQRFDIVRSVLPLDAFARCWIQEDKLMDTLGALIAAEQRPAFVALQRAWHHQHEVALDASVRALAEMLTASVLDGVEVKRSSVLQSAVKFVADKLTSALGMEGKELSTELTAARQKMAEELAKRMATATNQLIAAHDLAGSASEQLLSTQRDHFLAPQQVSESIWGAVGGVTTGAMAGLWADLHAGGFTLGGGMLAGGLVGAVSGIALAHGFNLVRGGDSRVHWSREHFREQVRLALLCYLAVAHFGRGRGEFEATHIPAVWDESVRSVIDHKGSAWDHIWRLAVHENAMPETVHREMSRQVRDSLLAVLKALYPR